MHVEPRGELCLQRLQLPGEFLRAGQHFAHFHESAHDEHAHAHSLWAVQDVGGHDGAVFSEGVGQVFDILPTVQGRNLRP